MAEKLYHLDTQLERVNAALHTHRLYETRWRRVINILLIAFTASVIASLIYFNEHYRVVIIRR